MLGPENDKRKTKHGEILIAVNPYKKLKIFELEDHEQYDWTKFEASAPPHIFNVAARAYQQMRETNTNQVILVSGESGAGKTESTKLMVKHFVHMCSQGSGDLHDKVIEVNPLLEAFGNAQTIMNDNSSRFAKFLELSFEGNGQVLGAVIRDYMLEKSRVINYSYDEGNFHIFYSLFAGASSEQLSNLQLKEAKDYKIMTFGSPELLKQTEVYKKMYTEQMSVLKQIGFNTEDMNILHCMLGAILHLTEVKFKESEKQNEALEIVNSEEVTTVAKLLNVNALDLGMGLTTIKTDYGAESVKILVRPGAGFPSADIKDLKVQIVFIGKQIHCLKSLEQARDGRDALAKAIYERLFGWIICRVNEDLNPFKQRSKVAATVGVLDIAGFENLHINSFEQLCINFVNERLQNFMNDTMLKTEKAIYNEEEIPCENVNFTNNMNIIELFTQKLGIFDLLDEETTLQQGSDENFVNKVINNHSDSLILVKISSNEPQFGIRHFAGTVTYRCEGFLENNRDTLNDDLFDVMKESRNEFLQDLFTVQKGPTGTISESHRQMKKSMLMSYSPKRHKSVLSYFRESMNELFEKMKSAEAHFVRCIKPNNMKQKENFNSNRVEEQLLYNGITDIAKIRRMGYPVRKKHIEFYKRIFKEKCLYIRETAAREEERKIAEELKRKEEKEWEDQEKMKARVLLRKLKREKLELWAVGVIYKFHQGWKVRKEYRSKFRSIAGLKIVKFFRVAIKKQFLLKLKEDLPSKSPLDKTWPKCSPLFSTTSEQLQEIHHRWRCMKYRQRFDETERYKMREKLTASKIFKDKKPTYSKTVPVPFKGDYQDIRQNPQWQKMADKIQDHHIIFSHLVKKINRANGKLVDQLLVMTTRFMHFLDHRTMMIKYMIPLSEVHRISVSPFQDCVVAVHLQKQQNGDLWSKKGDYVFLCDHLIELVAKSYIAIENSASKPPDVQIQNSIPALFSGSEVEITFTDGVQNLPPGTVKAARKKHNLSIMVQ